MRTRLLYPHLLLASIAGVAVFAGCAEEDPGKLPRAPGGVSGKPVVESPLGPAIADELVLRVLGDDGDARRLAAEVGGEVVWRGPRTGAFVVRFADGASATSALAALAGREGVLDVGPALVASGTGISTSPGRTIQWNLPAMSFNMAAGWGGGGGVQVAVIDTGVAYEAWIDALGAYALAPDLAGVTFAAGYDFVNDDDHANDDHGHGTHVTGIIASTGELVPVAAGAEIVPVKVLGADNLGTELALAEGLLFAADAGADVINLSLSFAPAFFPSRFLQDAVDETTASGAVVVAAVGNNGRSVVTYPAAFRDVIAVGASELGASFTPASQPEPWQRADQFLERAPYSNRGYLIDVVAPGGSISRDVDGDGNPEAILAQSFRSDPTDFEYLYYAGTSQAAAQVSGLLADMRAADPSLSAPQLRHLLGDTASAPDREVLTASTGRGFVSGRHALVQTGTALAGMARPTFSTGIHLTIHQDGDSLVARALVELADEAGAPAAGLAVYGSFTGGVYQSVVGTTDGAGRVQFQSRPLADEHVVAFQVEAVVVPTRPRVTVARPGGLVRIDSCSLDLLAQFGEAVGSGISTSPGVPISLSVPATAPGQIDTVLLLNFSWSGATAPMAIAADRAWFDDTFPDADVLRVNSFGSGRLGDPLRLTAGSFSIPLDDVDDDECVDLVVRTFAGSGISTSPGILPDPEGSCRTSALCEAYRLVLAEMWLGLVIDPGSYDGPIWSESTGISQAGYLQLAAMMAGYVAFAPEPLSSPVGDYDSALQAAGIGVAPYSSRIPTGLGAGSVEWE